MPIANIARSAAKPRYLTEMARKVLVRWRDGTERERPQATAWARSVAVDLDQWAMEQDPAHWAEAKRFAAAMREDAQPVVDRLEAEGMDMGGGGCYELLFFLVRWRRPSTVLETGVAAGWSTRSLLAGLDVNGHGWLYSSDFPYFRMRDPERYIGCLVPEELKGRWTLHIDGDRKNIGRILASSADLDLVHYDSDKSRAGRTWFMQQVRPRLPAGAVLVMDDVNDDLFFRDHFAGNGSRQHVFAFEGKYLGVVLL